MFKNLADKRNARQQIIAGISLFGKYFFVFGKNFVVQCTRQIWRYGDIAVGYELSHLRIVEAKGLVCHEHLVRLRRILVFLWNRVV